MDKRTAEAMSPESSSAVQAEGCTSPSHARKTITVRFSEAELEQLRAVAGQPLSKFIREAALGKADAIDLIARMKARADAEIEMVDAEVDRMAFEQVEA